MRRERRLEGSIVVNKVREARRIRFNAASGEYET